eukprot:scaffold435460_cov42-Prasinocladus_malaysianus.AAC.1
MGSAVSSFRNTRIRTPGRNRVRDDRDGSSGRRVLDLWQVHEAVQAKALGAGMPDQIGWEIGLKCPDGYKTTSLKRDGQYAFMDRKSSDEATSSRPPAVGGTDTSTGFWKAHFNNNNAVARISSDSGDSFSATDGRTQARKLAASPAWAKAVSTRRRLPDVISRRGVAAKRPQAGTSLKRYEYEHDFVLLTMRTP